MNGISKRTELEKSVEVFSKKHNVEIRLLIEDKFKIKKHSNKFTLSLAQKDLDTLDIELLQWHLHSNLNLIINGRFPSLKTQILLLVGPILYFAILCIVFDVFKLASPESITLKAFSIVFLSMYLIMSAWSRSKIFKADKSASIDTSKEAGLNFLMSKMNSDKELDFFSKDSGMFYLFFLLSSHPSYYQRASKLSK